MSDETITLTSRPVDSFSELARSLRVFAAVSGSDGRISLQMTADGAQTLAKALDQLEAFSKEKADFYAQADAKLAEVCKKLRNQLFRLGAYAVIVAALIWGFQ